MSETEVIDLQDLPAKVITQAEPAELPSADWPEQMNLQQALDSVERGLLLKAKEKFRNQVRMAEVLGVNQSTIARKLKKFGIE